jgi:adenine-specific DNA-methyltransferase
MDGKSLTPQEVKLQQLKEILPEAFTEGKVDWEKLKATLGEDINFANERYVLNWAGKSEAFKVLQAPTTKTLIPDKDESVNFDETEHIFIEGENLEILKVLQKSYFGKVKMIYIDPPYNTGKDSFIYSDKFSETKAEYEKRVGDKDEEGYLTKDSMFRKNSKENGQYHSNWLNMMYPRLFLAKNLLRQDGVIFVSIDDNEVHNFRLLMNEVFGEENFIGTIKRRASRKTAFLSNTMSDMCDYIVVYSKEALTDPLSVENVKDKTRPVFNEGNSIVERTINKGTESKIPNGIYNPGKYKARTIEFELLDQLEIKDGKTTNEVKIKGPFRINQELLNKTVYVTRNFSLRRYLLPEEMETAKLMSDLLDNSTCYNEQGSEELESLFGIRDVFSNPKPVKLIEYLIKACLSLTDNGEMIVLDFFAGSSTTAHAVMSYNLIENTNIKFISVQLPERLNLDQKEHKNAIDYLNKKGKPLNIAELSKERIKLAIDKYDYNTGFKVFKLSDSNFKQWQQIKGKDTKALEEQMKLFVDPVSENAITENMVYELMLKSGKDLNSKLEHKENYYCVNGNELILMLEKATQEIVDAVLKEKPQKVIALDRLFKDNDQLKTNTSLQMKDAGIEFKTI